MAFGSPLGCFFPRAGTARPLRLLGVLAFSLLLLRLMFLGEKSHLPLPSRKVHSPSHANLALGKPTYSSRGSDPAKRFVNDGFISGKGGSHALSLASGEYWEVDLSGPHVVEEVIVYGEAKRGTIMNVTLSLHDGAGTLLAQHSSISNTNFHVWHNASLGGVHRARVTAGGGEGSVILAEVEVLGPPQTDEEIPAAFEQELHLVVTYYQDSSEERREELKTAMRMNLLNPYIDRIHVLSEVPASQLGLSDPKLTLVDFPTQPHYSDFFAYANGVLSDKVVVISNADIVFTSSLKWAHPLVNRTESTILSLSRWSPRCPQDKLENESRNLCLLNYGSHDTFIFRSPIHLKDPEFFNVPMNRYGSEHRTNRGLADSGYKLLNPCLDIVGFHWHCSDLRNWKQKASSHHVDIGGQLVFLGSQTLLD